MTFQHPLYFLLLILIIPLIFHHYLLGKKKEHTIKMPTTRHLNGVSGGLRSKLVHLPFWLRIMTLVLLTIILARPQTSFSITEDETEGIDIMIAMDVSVSMLTNDFQPNRIEAAKKVAYDFIKNRPHDNIGLTLFGGEAFTQCPLTIDHTGLLSMFQNVSCDLQRQGIISSGTAIGMGIASAVSHLEGSKAKSKVIILLTDGENNTGDISPLMAAEMAKKMGVRVYTISLGNDGANRQQVAQLANGEYYEANIPHEENGHELEEIAKTTGGLYYRAETLAGLKKIYEEIDKLEKTKLSTININKRYEGYQIFAWFAIAFLLLEILLRITYLRRIP